MASFKITDLTELAAVDVADADLLEIVDFDADSSKKVSIQSLKTVFTATPAGSNTQIQFNDGGSFGASSGLTYDKLNTKLFVDNVNVLDRFRIMNNGVDAFRAYSAGSWISIVIPSTYTAQVDGGNWSFGAWNSNPDARLNVNLSTDQVGFITNLSNGQTADAFQINSYGNTGGNLFNVNSNGKTVSSNYINSTYTTVTQTEVVIGQNNTGFNDKYNRLNLVANNQMAVAINPNSMSFSGSGAYAYMSWSTNNFLKIGTGSSMITIDSNGVSASGNVGIGTSSPSTTLHAVGTTGKIVTIEGSLPELWFKDTFGSGDGLNFRKYSNQFYFSVTNASGTHQSYAGMFQLSSGRWTIGSGSNPLGQLDVKVQNAASIGQLINLANGQTADAFQINSYGNTGGDLFRVEDDGKTFVSGSSFSGVSRTFNVGGAIGIGTGSYQLAFNPNWTGGVGGIGTTSTHSFGIATAGVLGLVQDTSQNVGIGTTSIDASAKFQIDSTTQGALLPRMTTTQRDAISSPATGLLIFNTTTKKLDYYSGTAWGQV